MKEHSGSVDRTEVLVALIRADLKLHEFAATLKPPVHASYLGACLRGRRPINAALAQRIPAAVLARRGRGNGTSASANGGA